MPTERQAYADLLVTDYLAYTAQAERSMRRAHIAIGAIIAAIPLTTIAVFVLASFLP